MCSLCSFNNKQGNSKESYNVKKGMKNPLLTDEGNILANDDIICIELDDIIVGCIRAFNGNGRQSIVNSVKVIKILRELDYITAEGIKGCIRCSRAQAYRYLSTIKLCEPFIARWISKGATIRGYQEITREQILGGLLPIYVRPINQSSKEKKNVA